MSVVIIAGARSERLSLAVADPIAGGQGDLHLAVRRILEQDSDLVLAVSDPLPTLTPYRYIVPFHPTAPRGASPVPHFPAWAYRRPDRPIL